jgi:hypothetical protein
VPLTGAPAGFTASRVITDLAAQALRNSEAAILRLLQKIARASLDDGLEFEADSVDRDCQRHGEHAMARFRQATFVGRNGRVLKERSRGPPRA